MSAILVDYEFISADLMVEHLAGWAFSPDSSRRHHRRLGCVSIKKSPPQLNLRLNSRSPRVSSGECECKSVAVPQRDPCSF